MDVLLPAMIGFAIGIAALIVAADALLGRHNAVQALVMCGVACFFGGLAVVQMNGGSEQDMAFAPRWVWVGLFVGAGILFMSGLIIWSATAAMTLVLKHGIAGGYRVKHPRGAKVTPIDGNRTPASVRAIEERFRLSKEEPEGIDIKLPRGRAWKRAK